MTEHQDPYLYATFTAAVSYLVSGRCRKEAIQLATFRLNESTIRLNRTQLVNDKGEKLTFTVDKVLSLDWTDAEIFSEFNDRYRVTGQIRLIFRIDTRNASQGKALFGSYKLRKALFDDRTAWTIPTNREPAFVLVMSQSLEWNNIPIVYSYRLKGVEAKIS
ncbi:hypothetical protein BG53_03625 [Paenibacillus darwinianus]|uniref:Uncharacterized protein n=1 Tax=Paenibacillus darwinianus TaxID=1380763 RepID=A0A9W5S019_9BACL|nr:hypothetical protein [Paenibacillus darwinianus]EXX87683.1 hypothetical protein BG53_03625 [Paenibacillus darwinianus]EXX90068.1 hypothetical protein BG52_14270 [Paenibacillus darwinianus]EXX90893.1 hypothetical protein CH50_14610 [Paenibacillus darwinianus]